MAADSPVCLVEPGTIDCIVDLLGVSGKLQLSGQFHP